LKVCVVGAGHIGLPTACVIAESGFQVVAADINEKLVEAIKNGKSLIKEHNLDSLIAKVVKEKRLTATTDVTGATKESDVVLIIVPTPLGTAGPDLNAIKSAAKAIARGLRRGMLIILESTIYPEGTKTILQPILEENSGLRAGEDFYLAYSPERALPTRSIDEIKTNVRIVGGINIASGKKAKEFYGKFVTSEVLDVGDSTTAEFVKISENVYRDVNIALANELALIAEKLGVDIQTVITAANRHPRVNIHVPGAGVGGHCIPKDPYFFINKAREKGIEVRLIKTAREINESMPEHVVELAENALEKSGKTPADSKIAILGYAYKGDTSDIRGTPAERIVSELKSLGFKISIHDPYVNYSNGTKIDRDMDSVVTDSDCVVIVTDHNEYRNINIQELAKKMRKPGVIIDGRNIFNPDSVRKAGLIYCGIGR